VTSPTELVLVLVSPLSVTLEELSTSLSSSPPTKENQPPAQENRWLTLFTLTTIEEVSVSTIMNELSDDLVGTEGGGSDDSGVLDSGVKLEKMSRLGSFPYSPRTEKYWELSPSSLSLLHLSSNRIYFLYNPWGYHSGMKRRQ